MRPHAAQIGPSGVHEAHRFHPRIESGEHGRGRWPLQGQQRALVSRHETHVGRQTRLDVGAVSRLSRGVEDEVEVAGLGLRRGTGRHKVVENAAVLGQQLRVALPPWREMDQVGRDERLQRSSDRFPVRSCERRLAHVRYVEEAGVFARPEVLAQDALRILHRHLVARERHKLGAGVAMRPVQRSLEEGGGRIGQRFARDRREAATP